MKKYLKIKKKEIVSIFWSYGKDNVKINEVSKHYTDLNLNIKTKGYIEGDLVKVDILNKSFHVTMGENGNGFVENILEHEFIEIGER